MNAVRMRVKAELRANARALVALGILFGVFAGVVASSAAGARRTDSVVDRAIVAEDAPDIFMVPLFTEHGELLDFDKISRFHEVRWGVRLAGPGAKEDLLLNTFRSVADEHRFAGLRMVEGRMPRAADEALINTHAVQRRGLHLGSRVTLHLAGVGSDPNTDVFRPGPVVTLRVVGVGNTLGDLVDIADPGLTLPSAFFERYAPALSIVDVYVFSLRNHDADLPAFRRHVEDLTGGKGIFFSEARNDYNQLRRSFRVQASALWVLAGLLGFVTVLILVQTLARQAFLASNDRSALRALGMSGPQLGAIHVARGAFIAVVAVVVAAAVAIGTSPLTPFGRARLAEPHPGLRIAWPTIGITAVVLLVVCVVASLLASIRGGARGATPGARPSIVAGTAARSVPGLSAAVGARFAFEPGTGRTAVPVRSTLAGCSIGVTALIAALIVGASLTHLLGTPRAYGWNWDAQVGSEGLETAARRAAFESIPGVEATSYGFSGAQLVVGSTQTDASAMTPGKGTLGPVLLEGRLPRTATEIALGRKTLEAAGVQIGDAVEVSIPGSKRRGRFVVTGLVVLPFSSDTSTLGEGAFITIEGVYSLDADINGRPPDGVFVRFAPDADRPTVLKRLNELANQDGVMLPTEPAAVVDFGNVRAMPLVLGAILALLAAGTIAHLLVTSIRRRGRDLAILKTLGLVRSQMRAVVAWQATSLASAALLIAVPLGIAAGRWVWSTFARYGGFAPEPIVGAVPIAIVALATLALANIIALLPARAAARTSPALVLRTE